MTDDSGGESELAGQELIRPLKQISPGSHASHLVAEVNLYPGLHVQSLSAADPVGEVKFAGHAAIRLPFPPAQYDPLVQMGHGLVPDLEPFPKYPGAHRHWFCEVESPGLMVLLGQRLLVPAMHQELLGHAEQLLLPPVLSRK